MILWGPCDNLNLRVKTTAGWMRLGDGQTYDSAERCTLRTAYIWCYETSDPTWEALICKVSDDPYDQWWTPAEAVEWMCAQPRTAKGLVRVSAPSIAVANEKKWQSDLRAFLKALPDRDKATAHMRAVCKAYL